MDITLKLIKQRLKKLVPQFTWQSENTSVKGGVATLRLKGLVKLRNAINEIDNLQIFPDNIHSLTASMLFTSGNDEMDIQNAEAFNIINNLNSLKSLLNNFLDTLTKTLPEEDPSSVNIKLPPVKDFNDLSLVSKDFHIALSQILFNEEINGETRIVSVENGSIWLNVFVGTVALGVIASLTWSAAVVYKKILEGKLLAEQVRSLKVKNDSLQDILKAQKNETENLIQAEAAFIASEHFTNSSPEQIERIKNSIKLFSELIDKGAEIHPALVAPENVTNLFPDPKNIIGLESKIKKLGMSA